MKPSLLILVFIFFTNLSAVERKDHLARFRWDYRIILVNAPAEALDRIEKKLSVNKAAMNERHILWFIVVDGQLHTNFSETLPKDFAANIVNHYFSDANKGKGICLIGKDGSVKARQQNLDLKKLFAQIDRMPMRQAEMKKNGYS